ncbi:major tail protein [Streptococcus varani]|uniref:Major tail protein n=1 Tax=Streptococcus varani TaxID=1608583 RepID=A0A0E3WEZ3_9STRE|nr:major tail protein [Streptococcus varani]CQR24578.1 major tail protein [Streptococcus varani]
MTLVGFESAVIRILDGKGPATEGENLFTIKGDDSKGATKTAQVSGLAVDPVTSWGSNRPYHISRKGVGEPKVEFSAIDIPLACQHKILGRKEKSGLIVGGSETEAPECSLALYAHDPRGVKVAIGFFVGVFSLDSLEIASSEGKAAELAEDKLTFVPRASDDETFDGDVYTIADTKERITTMVTALKHISAG